MSYQTPTRNYATESSNQRSNNARFEWSVVAALIPGLKKCVTGILVSALFHSVDLASIEFPIALSQIKKFKTLNDISNVWYIHG